MAAMKILFMLNSINNYIYVGLWHKMHISSLYQCVMIVGAYRMHVYVSQNLAQYDIIYQLKKEDAISP